MTDHFSNCLMITNLMIDISGNCLMMTSLIIDQTDDRPLKYLLMMTKWIIEQTDDRPPCCMREHLWESSLFEPRLLPVSMVMNCSQQTSPVQEQCGGECLSL